MNALKHGLTAVELTLPTETTDAIQAHAEFLFESLQPVTNDEIELADIGALTSLRLARIARAETEILADQIRNAVAKFDLEQETKLQDCKELMTKNPGRAVLGLKSFATGVRFLIHEWVVVKQCFNNHNSFLDYEPIRAALRLQGYDPDKLGEETFMATEFTTRALACDPRMYKSEEGRKRLNKEVRIGSRYAGALDEMFAYKVDESVKVIKAFIDEQISELRELHIKLYPLEAASRNGAKTRAMILDDTKENRLMVRYSGSLQRGLERVIKTLAKARDDREEAFEMESEEAVSEVPKAEKRNEPDNPSEATSSPIKEGACVVVNARKYSVSDVSDGNLLLCVVEEAPQASSNAKGNTDLRDVSVPETGV